MNDMPANLGLVEGRVTMAYASATPWHGLGTYVEGNPDVPTMLKAANLDWKVSTEPTFLKDGIEVPNRFAVVRDVDRAVLGSVGADYEVKQNLDAFMVLQPAYEQFGITIETAGALGKGDRVWMLAKMPNKIEVVKGDKIGGYFLVTTGHNGWTTHSGWLTPIRTVCENTYRLAMKEGSVYFKLKHVASSSQSLDEIAKMITRLVAALKDQKESFAKMAFRKMNEVQIREYVDAVLGLEKRDPEKPSMLEKRADNILYLTKNGKGVQYAPGTLWTAFNAISEYTDHVRPAEVKAASTIKSANESALFGANARLKLKALQMAEKIAA